MTTIKILREYGPYEDGRPNLPSGIYVAEIVGMDPYSKKATAFKVVHREHSYAIRPQDVEVQ